MSLRLIFGLVATAVSATLVLVSAPAQAVTPPPTPPPGSASPVTSTPPASPTPESATPAPEDTSAAAETASPTAETASPTAETASPTAGNPSETAAATPSPTTDPTRSATQPQAQAQAPAPRSLTLAITAGGTPQAGRFFEDIGYYAISGAVSDHAAGTTVSIYWYDAKTKAWRKIRTVKTTAKGAYAANPKVGFAATIGFRSTLGGVPGKPGVTSSNQVNVTSRNSFVKQNKPVASIDSLKNPTVSGSVYPARPGVDVNIQVRRADKLYRTTVHARTNAAGTYRASLAYGNGNLATYSVRSAYKAINRDRWEIGSANNVKRVKALSAVITKTTAAEVAKTYRGGCPVGPSKLRTIRMNYFGFDKKMHRGVIIVRSSLTGKITRGFTKAMNGGYPIAKMRNPNDYGGNDPRQMEANNTSGFNCRKVVGNPYAQSPHSYGIAIDVNTVQNPYRDSKGKWWPKNGKSYIDRTPTRRGMLSTKSSLTKQLRKDGYFWGGFWNPGKDYQHFEYDK